MAGWPDFLQEVVRRHGPEVVWRAGMKLKGYPPNLAEAASELVGLYQTILNLEGERKL